MKVVDFDKVDHHFTCSRCGKVYEGRGYSLHYEFMKHVWKHEDEEMEEELGKLESSGTRS